jgi:hypothetical protein
LSNELKHYHKAVGVVYCDQMQRWILAYVEKTDKGIQVGGFSSVSDGMAIVSAAEKLSHTGLRDEQDPLLISIAADTSQTGFYPFSIPVMEGARQESLIAAQAEAIVPMPLPQTMYSWRMMQRDSAMQHGFLSVVRRGYFQELAGMASGKPESMMPDATGLVRAWSAMFESLPQRSLLIQIRKRHCILALCDQEKLIRAAAMDWDDNPGAAGMMVGDLLNLIETLDIPASVPLFITGPDSQAQILCNEMKTIGKSVSLWKLSPDKLNKLGLTAILPSEAQHCPQAAGLALAAIDEEPGEFDLIRKPVTRGSSQVVIDKQLYLRGLLWTAALLAIFLGVSYWTTQREVRTIQQALSASYNDTTGEKILTRQQTRERFAKSRPDMLELLILLDTCAGNDIMIDSFNFKKGQPVRLTAKTNSQSYDRVYAFDKKIKEQSGISGVKLISPTLDEKKRQVSFTLTFNYKNFSK